MKEGEEKNKKKMAISFFYEKYLLWGLVRFSGKNLPRIGNQTHGIWRKKSSKYDF